MKYRELQVFPNTTSKPLLFKGINKKELIGDDELSDGKNLRTDTIPAISPREPMSVIKTLQNPSYYGRVNGIDYYIDGTNFYYNGTSRGTVTAGKKSIVDFNGVLVIFPDKKYYDYIDGVYGSFTAPDIDFATVHYNRIFGIKGSDIRASKVGDFKEWEQFQGNEMDSWATDVYSPGDFTGITSYQDHVIFFKRNQMYELYGYTPSQFKVMESSKIGCVDSESIAEVQGILYFMSEKGVQSYAGGYPRSVSENLNLSNVTNASAVGDGRNYYVSVGDLTYIFDTWANTWLPHIDKTFINFSKDSDKIYGLCSDKKVYQLANGDETVEWSATTKLFDDGMFNKKSVKSIKIKARMEEGSELKVYLSLDEGDFKLRKHIKNTEMYHRKQRDIIIVIPINRASTYQIRFEGRGKATIYGEKVITVGSER